MQIMTLGDFASCVNKTFRVNLEQGMGHADFTLVEARPIGAQLSTDGQLREPFSLLFLNDAAVVFPQRIYSMTHDAFGEFGIFLVPIARNTDGFIYQAVFN